MKIVNIRPNLELHAIKIGWVGSSNNKPILLSPNTSVFYESVSIAHTDVFDKR